ncbi:Phosphatidate cytidylyltransferase [Entamoeba marina]
MLSQSTQKRFITGTLFSIFAIGMVYWSLFTFQIAEMLVVFIMFYEYNVVVGASTAGMITSLIVYIIQFTLALHSYELVVQVFPSVCIIAYFTYGAISTNVTQAIQLLFGSIWCLHLTFYSLAIAELTSTTLSSLYVVFLAIWSDAFQFFFGKFFGKTKPLTYLSPNKSIEGYAGGLLMLIVVSFLTQDSILFMVIIFIAGVIGDLVASCLKRYFNVKDFGNCLPGMGGMFDRLDSPCFCCAVAYYWYMYEGFNPGLLMRCILKFFYFTNDECF